MGDDGRGETVSAIGTWDVKHVLGEADVAPDGSCTFECPANNAVYFQLLDSLGRCVQTMRSWTMVAPGEESACVGCHEDKMQVYPADKGIASSKVQRLHPAAGQPPHPLLARLDKENMLASATNYLGVDAPRSSDPNAPTEGFSFVQRIQPILSAHCVKCHDGTEKCKWRPDLTAAWDPSFKDGSARKYSKAYRSLTSGGAQTARLNWSSNAGRSEMLPPCAQGSTQSKIMEHLEPAHHGVKVSDAESGSSPVGSILRFPLQGRMPNRPFGRRRTAIFSNTTRANAPCSRKRKFVRLRSNDGEISKLWDCV